MPSLRDAASRRLPLMPPRAKESSLILKFNDSPQTMELEPRVSRAYLAQQMSLDQALEMSAILQTSPTGFVPMPDHLQVACGQMLLLEWEPISLSVN
jgi:hypothetical protein